MGVNILERTAPASNGAQIDTGTAFVVGAIGSGSQTAPVEVSSIPDFEAAFSTRTGAAVPAWDWLDVYFREGGSKAYVLDYATTGGEATALGLIPASLGPGQVVVVGEAASSSVYGALQAHADGNNRIGLLDVLSSDASPTALEAEGTLAQALTSKENVGVFGSWVQVPAPAGVIGASSRQVPASAVIAALCNRVDQDGNPNQPAGGYDYPLQYVTGFVYDPPDPTTQAALKAKGVNFFHDAWGRLENYGFLTPLYTGDNSIFGVTPFAQLNCARARMWLKAKAAPIGEKYYMKDIDSQGKLAAALGSDLAALCKQLYDAGGLYSVDGTPGGAYSVNVGQSVNNTGTEATGTLNAVAEVRFSQYADTVNITLVSVPVTGQIS